MKNLINTSVKTIAIDFDGTIVEHRYPKIGKQKLFAFATIQALQRKGHKLIHDLRILSTQIIGLYI